MDLRKWSVLLAVVDYGSFTKAGEELNYTQSGITHMMKSLEQEVGFPLFKATTASLSRKKEKPFFRQYGIFSQPTSR